MPDYKKMYATLFNQVTDVIELLKDAQQKAEEMYIHSDDVPLRIRSDEDKSPKK